MHTSVSELSASSVELDFSRTRRLCSEEIRVLIDIFSMLSTSQEPSFVMCYVLDVIYAKSSHSIYARSTFHERFTKRAWPELTVTEIACTPELEVFTLAIVGALMLPNGTGYDRGVSRPGWRTRLSYLCYSIPMQTC